LILYSQRDPRWANHALGWGASHGTLGQYGCFTTVLAMIANDSGHQVDPPGMDDLFTAKRTFVRDPTGAFDLLPDNALVQVYAGDYEETSYGGWRADLVGKAVPSPNTYAILWISTSVVPTHFVLAYSADGRLIADPWTGRVGVLAGYGGPGAVRKTMLVSRLPRQGPAPAPPPNPIPTPEPVPPPTPPVMDFYAFVPDPPDDLHPADEVTTLADAMQLANDYIANKPMGTVITVCDAGGNQIYQAAATPAPV
jgi:hypothetical protein